MRVRLFLLVLASAPVLAQTQTALPPDINPVTLSRLPWVTPADLDEEGKKLLAERPTQAKPGPGPTHVTSYSPRDRSLGIPSGANSPVGARFFQLMSESDALLLGRKTWQIHGGAFEPMQPGDPFGDVMNAVKKYVVSRTLTSASAWRNSTLIRDDVPGTVRRLKQESGKNILLDGSSVLVHTLIEEDLVYEYRLHLYPVSLGGGKRLFPEGQRLDLTLAESAALPNGVVYMRYRRARSA